MSLGFSGHRGEHGAHDPALGVIPLHLAEILTGQQRRHGRFSCLKALFTWLPRSVFCSLTS